MSDFAKHLKISYLYSEESESFKAWDVFPMFKKWSFFDPVVLPIDVHFRL